jgi:repressor of nif and glnA expression
VIQLEILAYLQGTGSHGSNHSIDFILALYEITLKRKKVDRINPIISNKDILTWIREHGGTISNITVQYRKAELADMGIVTKHRRKRGSGEDIKLTNKGLKIGEVMKRFSDEIATV